MKNEETYCLQILLTKIFSSIFAVIISSFERAQLAQTLHINVTSISSESKCKLIWFSFASYNEKILISIFSDKFNTLLTWNKVKNPASKERLSFVFSVSQQTDIWLVQSLWISSTDSSTFWRSCENHYSAIHWQHQPSHQFGNRTMSHSPSYFLQYNALRAQAAWESR